ncbi:deaminase [Reyranella sp.]|uniref:deaminase n=1 Tax=Reyranella sp. TaxID=1929291 RepID=UPI003782DB31
MGASAGSRRTRSLLRGRGVSHEGRSGGPRRSALRRGDGRRRNHRRLRTEPRQQRPQPDAHAERVALWEAQKRLGRQVLKGAVVYATSRPCAACQRALASAGVERMRVGPTAEDAGPPRATG